MAPRSTRQFAQMREDSRERILDSALAVFAEHGFAGASVRRIAARGGISQGLLYNYFDGKDALLRALFERNMADVAASFATARAAGASGSAVPANRRGPADLTDPADPADPADRSDAANGSGAAGVEALVRAAFTIVREHRAFWQLSYQLRMQPAVQASLGDGLQRWTTAILSELDALLDADAAAAPAPAPAPGPGPAPSIRARALFAAIDGAAQHYVLDPDAYPVAAVAAEIARRFAPSAGITEAHHETEGGTEL